MKARRFLPVLLLCFFLQFIPLSASADVSNEEQNEYNFTVWTKIEYRQLRGRSKVKTQTVYFDFDNEIAALYEITTNRMNSTKPNLVSYELYRMTQDSDGIISLFNPQNEEHRWKWKVETENLFFGMTFSRAYPCDSEGNKIESETFRFTSSEVDEQPIYNLSRTSFYRKYPSPAEFLSVFPSE